VTFRTHNDLHVDINGTCLRGYKHATYAKLVDTFGPPTTGDDYKTDVEWHLLFRDGTVATIYNWKNGPAYCGDAGTPIEELTDWNIGGNSGNALDYIQRILLEAN
jgi:hypothetical protein